jgi:hypothetical protein
MGDFARAQTRAKNAGSQGDYRAYAKPRVLWLPDPDNFTFCYAFVWKQDQKGMAFVISPIPLPWLDRNR